MKSEFECYVVKYQNNLYAIRLFGSRYSLTGQKCTSPERLDCPDTEDLEIIARSLGVPVSELSVYKRTITERISAPAKVQNFPSIQLD